MTEEQKAKMVAYHKRWQIEHPEKVREYSAKWRSKPESKVYISAYRKGYLAGINKCKAKLLDLMPALCGQIR